MSADFWSVCVSIPPIEAVEFYAEHAPRQVRGAVIGPDEETLFALCRLRLEEIAAAWQRMLDEAGGRARAMRLIASVVDRWGNGEEDADTLVTAVEAALGDAQVQGLDLLLYSCPVP